MTLRFVGGPYDGMVRAVIDCRRVMSFLEIRTGSGLQKFVMLPSPTDWPAIAKGLIRLQDSRSFYYYERISDHEVPVYLYDPNGSRYKAVLFESL